MLFKLLFILCLYLPFQIALNPAPGIDLASIRVFVLVLFFLWIFDGLKNKKIIIKNSFLASLIGSFIFLNIFSVFFAENLDWSLRKLIYLFSIFPIYFIASDLIDSPEKNYKIIKALVISGLGVAFLGMVQFIGQFFFGLEKIYQISSDYLAPFFLGKTFSMAVLENSSWLVNVAGRDYFRAISIFPDPHMFSVYLGLILPLSLGLSVVSKKKYWLIFSLIIFFADILTFSRGGYLGLVSSIFFFLIFFWNKISYKYKIISIIGTAGIIMGLVIPNPISFRFISSFDFEEGSNSGRIEMWQKALETIVKHPFFGVGLGNFPLKVDSTVDYRVPIYAHSAYLDIASEAGILTSLVWIMILAYSFKVFIGKSKENKLYLYLAGSLVIFSIHSIFETSLYSPVNLTLLLIILSMAKKNEKIT